MIKRWEKFVVAIYGEVAEPWWIIANDEGQVANETNPWEKRDLIAIILIPRIKIELNVSENYQEYLPILKV